jgi:N4-gp56 family major capsid protein
MPNFTWTYDIPGGPLKDHQISREVYEQAIAETAFMEHVGVKKALGTRSGESVTFPRTSALAEQTDYTLVETQDIPERPFAASSILVQVKEKGSAVPYTMLARDLTTFELEPQIRNALKDEQKLMLDTEAAAAMKKGRIKYAITGATTNNITTNGVFGATSTVNMNVFHAEEISDYLYGVLLAAPAMNGDYVGIFNYAGIRGIMRDPSWEDWHRYTDPAAKFNGEVGRLERIRFVRTNHARALGKVGTGGVLGEGVVFGMNSLAFVEAKSIDIYATPPQGHAGRFLAFSWYGVLGFRMIYEDSANAGEASVVHVGSL